MLVRRTGWSPIFLPKMQAPLGWSCGLDSASPAPQAGPPPHRCFPSRRPADCYQMPSTGRQRRLIPCLPCSSRISEPSYAGEKDQLETCRSPQFRRPAGPATAHAERRTRKRRSASAAPDRAADGPLPACRHLQHKRPVAPRTSRNRNGTPPRWPSARQAGRIWAAGNGMEVKDRRRCPQNCSSSSRRRPESSHAGRYPRLRLQYALMPM